MKTKFLSFLIAYLIVANVFSQSNLNNYKYVIIPKEYEFLKEADQFQLNSLTEFLFNKYGFQAFMEGENYPEDLNANRCLALATNVLKDSSLFKTKLQIELKDCNGSTIYTTKVGESREKDYARAYSEALREAFSELESIGYKYVPGSNNSKLPAKQVEPAQNEVAQEIAQLKQEIENMKKAKEVEYIDTVVPKEVGEEVFNDNSIVPSEKKNIIEGSSNILYAQQIENGFQLVDSSPKVVYKIKNTSLENVFLVEGKNATLYKKGDTWIMEYYENNVLKQEELNIKF